MSKFELSASLEGHGDDVRAVAFPNPQTVLTASRDATVRQWKQVSSPPPTYDYTITSHGSAFVNSVAYYPPTSEYPEGLIFSGGQDSIIEAKQPGKAAGDNADAMLLGHGHNVCSIDVCPDGGWIVSGSWDSTARIWKIGVWETDVILDGHQGSVWAVLAYDRDTVVTGAADRIIRIFNTSGRLLRSIKDSRDVVRALCKLPPNHPTGAQFASASNDGIIRLFTLDGVLVAELHGHESFIYSLAVLPSGEIVSSGEDRTVRVWNGTQCIQNITLPAISVWSVAVSESGDIVSGSSDRIARVFTRDPSRRADPTVIAQFENAVRESAIPKQQVGNINKEKLPGPDFLKRKAGTKEGQVQMIREDNGTVTAHTWSMATREWIPVGTVVDSAGSSGRKTEYLGQDYDYVFDVDIEDGKPPLKLPYNLSQNPFEAATKFLQDNNLPMGYLDQVANFIIQNTQGATIGQTDEQSQAAPPDPWGQDKRYRPGDAVAAAQAPSATPARQDVLPQKSYLSIKTANLNLVTKKLQELNEQLISSGNKEVSLNPPELETILALCKRLESSGTLPQDVESVEAGISLISKAALKWPPASRLPGVDLLRIVAAATPAAAQIQYDGQDIVSAVKSANLIDPNGNANHSMLAIRLFANLFETAPGRQLAVDSFDTILPLVTSVTSGSPNRNITIAATTLYINYAVYFTTGGRAKSAESAERGLQLVDELSKILGNEKDSEAIYRGLVALGTLVKEIADEVLSAARDVYNLRTILNSVLNSGAGREPRIKGVVEEIRRLL
ncbi:hypothetical protein VTN31DRAFT_4788 [Thermomyces dupontii]|uniref:uncharacterized protein n=1 Tax=Talaromyces thermophilus TaxID=28565 RepID=UPI003743F58E